MAITKDKKISASVLSVALLFFIVGGCLLLADLLEYKEGVDSRKWLPIDGSIKTQSIKLVNRDGGINHFSLNANYVYHVDDQAYRGDRVAYPNAILFTAEQPDKPNKEDIGKSMFAKYAPDASVTVFYNPSDKKQSTLTQGASARSYLVQWLRDAALIGLAIAMTVWGLRMTKSNKPIS